MKKHINLVLLLMAFFCLAAIPVHAQKAADTSGLQFTTIPTAADSMAIKKAQAKKDSVVAAQKAADNAKKTAKEDAPKTLWQIFIAGFLGGLIAVTMPCIYPML